MARKKTSSRRRSTTRGGTTSRRKTTRRRSTSRKSRLRRPQFNLTLDLPQKALIIGIALIFFTAIVVLSMLSPSQGQLTSALAGLMWRLFGWGAVIVPLMLGALGFFLVLWGMDQPPQLPGLRLTGFIVLFLTVEAFASLAWVAWDNPYNDVTAVAEAGTGGGYLGGIVAWAMTRAIGRLGAVFVLFVVGILATVLTSGLTRHDAGIFLQRLLSRTRAEREIPINPGQATSRTLPAGQAEAAATQPRLLPPEPSKSVPASSAAKAEPPSPPRQPATKPERASRRRGRSALDQDQVVAPTPVFLGSGNGHDWTLPNVADLLEASSDQEISSSYIREQVEIIEHTLESFGAPATVVEINQGPTITQYGVEPSFIEQRSGKRTKVKVGKIASLADDLSLALAARSIRIQAPVPGKGYVGIEVPNSTKALVSLRDVMESAEFDRVKSPLRIGLGQNVAGQPIATDLAQMPHLLIAGTTGAGKSVCVNALIACLLLQNSPEDLKMVMVDPKRVELTGYNGIPHLVAPVIVDLERVVGTLQWAMREMDNRYKRLADMGARNVVEFNRKAVAKKVEKMPYIVIVIDELADLMMLAPEDTERGITRLAQMARATGIHMVIATQRPSVDVVTGLIKANFPARIAFAVASSTDSRVILDTTGAERLLGQGDMLFQSPDAAAPVRMQGCFVSEKELHNTIAYWQNARRALRASAQSETVQAPRQDLRPDRQAAPEPREETAAEGDAPAAPDAGEVPAAQSVPPSKEPPAAEQPHTLQQPLWEELQAAQAEAENELDDELLPEAIDLVRQLGKASTSLLQRRFRIGYTRAARIIDYMEENSIIGPPTGTSKAREVLPPAEPAGSGDETAAHETAGESIGES